jgi:hypothetical protein
MSGLLGEFQSCSATRFRVRWTPLGRNQSELRFSAVSARPETEPEKLRRRGDVPAPLEHSLRRGLTSSPHERHADMRALLDELEDALLWGTT